MSDDRYYVNTDRELWREPPGDYYANSIHVTEGGGIGINCGGHVLVMPLRQWHALASSERPRTGMEDGLLAAQARIAELQADLLRLRRLLEESDAKKASEP